MFSNLASTGPAEPTMMKASAHMNEFNFNLDFVQRINEADYYADEGSYFAAKGTQNPSTGYYWTVNVDPDHSCGPYGSITYTKEFTRSNSQILGAPGQVEFQFHVNEKAKKGSECRIFFSNHGPGSNANIGPDRWFDVHIY